MALTLHPICYNTLIRNGLMRSYFLPTTIALLVITLATVAYGALLHNGNARIEAKCAAQGGQVITSPGEIIRCLRPAR